MIPMFNFIHKISEASLVAFCDIDKAKAQLAAETYGSDDSKVYEDYRDLLADKTIDIVHICTLTIVFIYL